MVMVDAVASNLSAGDHQPETTAQREIILLTIVV